LKTKEFDGDVYLGFSELKLLQVEQEVDNKAH